MKIFLNTEDMLNPQIEITTSKEDILSQLGDEWNSPFDNLGTQEFGEDKGAEIFAIWLDDSDNRKEPTTAKGMMKRLGILKEWKHLLGHKNCKFVVDDRALIINVK